MAMHQCNEAQNLEEISVDVSQRETDPDVLSMAASHSLNFRLTFIL